MDPALQEETLKRLRSELLANSRVTTMFMGNPKHAFKDEGFFYEDRHFLHFHPIEDGFQADLRFFAGDRTELLKDQRAQPHTLSVANETGWLLYNMKSEQDADAFIEVVRGMLVAAEKREPAKFRQLQP